MAEIYQDIGAIQGLIWVSRNNLQWWNEMAKMMTMTMKITLGSWRVKSQDYLLWTALSYIQSSVGERHLNRTLKSLGWMKKLKYWSPEGVGNTFKLSKRKKMGIDNILLVMSWTLPALLKLIFWKGLKKSTFLSVFICLCLSLSVLSFFDQFPSFLVKDLAPSALSPALPANLSRQSILKHLLSG